MKKVMICFLSGLICAGVSAIGEEEVAGSAEELPHFYLSTVDPESLDPALIIGLPEHVIFMALFEGLVTYDPETLEAVPAVAESWEISADGMTYTFRLRDNATWSDGTPITARQFVGSWLRVLDPQTASKNAHMLNMVVKGASEYNSGEAGPEAVAIRAVDKHTFRFDLVGPLPYALDMLSHFAFSVQPLHTIEKHGNDWTKQENFVGNGPFVLEDWIPQDRIVVRRNNTYWDREKVKLGRISFLVIEDDNTAFNMFLAGEMDWVGCIPADRLDEVRFHDFYHSTPAFTTYFYRFNTRDPPLDDRRVRKALAFSINRQELIDSVIRGGEFAAFAVTPPLPYYPAVVGFREDVATARRLLAEAGYPNGDGFPRLTIQYNTHQHHKRIAEYIQQKWNENLGIEVELINKEWKVFLSSLTTGDYQVSRAGWIGSYLDPITFLDMWITGSDLNTGGWSNTEFDGLIQRAVRMAAGLERLQVLRRAEEILITEEMAVMPFYYYTIENCIDTTKWGGWYENVLDLHPWKTIYRK